MRKRWRPWSGPWLPQNRPRGNAVSLGEIRNLDYTILLCSKMIETRAFYRDIMRFPIETERANWGSFRVGASLLTLRPRGKWSVCDDGPSLAGSVAVQLAFRSRRRRWTPAMRSWSPRAYRFSEDQPICPTGATVRCSFAILRATSSKSTLNTDRNTRVRISACRGRLCPTSPCRAGAPPARACARGPAPRVRGGLPAARPSPTCRVRWRRARRCRRAARRS
jgi:hypothetical protein